MRKPQKFSQAHFLPSLVIVGLLLALFVWSIAHAINTAATSGSSSDDCSNCGIEVKDE